MKPRFRGHLIGKGEKSLLEGNHFFFTGKKNTEHTLHTTTHTYRQFSVANHATSMFLDGRRKPAKTQGGHVKLQAYSK